MAKVLFGSEVVDMRNKIGGHVYSKNRYGNYKRTKVTPVNPQTSYQQQQRQLLGNTSSGWRGLTQSERDSWIDAAPNFPVTSIFGTPMILSGQALYVMLNKNLQNAGVSPITTAPTPVAIPTLALTSVVSDVSSTTVTLTTTPGTVPADFALFVFATPLITPGRNFIKNRLRFIGIIDESVAIGNVYTDWNARFGLLVADQKVFVKIFFVSKITGQAGVPLQDYAIVTA